MADKAREWTDKQLSQMEKKISDIYKEAQDGITQKWDAYMKESGSVVADLQKAYDDAKKSGDKDLIKSTGKKLQQAKTEQTIYSTSYKEMVEATAKQLANANQIALAYMNGQIPSIYAKNYSQIGEDLKSVIPKFKGETDKSVLKIVNEDVVKNMITEGDLKMPNLAKQLSIPKDMRWNTKQINSSVLQGILQGDTMNKIADRLLPIMDHNKSASIRNARTLVTGVENRGRLDSYERLEDEGIVMKKVWIATPDDRTRESHLAMDGQEVDIDEPFVDGDGNELDYPADPDGEPETVYNCRCSMKSHIIGFKKADGSISEVDFEREESKHDQAIEAEKERRIEEAKEEPVAEPIPKSNTLTYLENSNIMYKEVELLSAPLSESEIIEKIGGGDRTKGSCSSLTFAYAGNQSGYDVTDFRGGNSLDFFSRTKNIVDIANLPNVDGVIIKHTNDFVATELLLKDIPQGKEYILSVAKHSAIVRRTETGYEFLELQSATNNGWHQLTNSTLKSRFGCQKSHTFYGEKYEVSNILIDVENLDKNPEFKNILGYLNTATDAQKKGFGGYAK